MKRVESSRSPIRSIRPVCPALQTLARIAAKVCNPSNSTKIKQDTAVQLGFGGCALLQPILHNNNNTLTSTSGGFFAFAQPRWKHWGKQ
jgi:hypothetical protein